jgi:hypothetical protein
MKRLLAYYVIIFALVIGWSVAEARDVALSWDLVANDSRVAGYEVHYGPTSGMYTSLVDVDGADSDIVSIVGLDDGAEYFFAVRARNSDSTLVSLFSNEVSIEPELNLSVPDNFRLISITTTVIIELGD